MFVEFGKHILQFTAKLRTNLLADKIHAERRHIVLQLAEFMHEIRRNHVLPLRKYLAQFHERRPKLHESHAQAFRHAVFGGDFRRLVLSPRHEQPLHGLRYAFAQ